MPLLDILQDISSRNGVNLENSGEKNILITHVNQAAKELYESYDLQESLDQEIFDLNVESQLVAFPWYVEYIRGMRYFDGRRPISFDDKLNRFGVDYGNEVWRLKFRDFKKCPLKRDINNESVLKFSIPVAETSSFTISIVGATSNSARVEEVLQWPAGVLSIQSVGNYKMPINGIIKSSSTQYDITVKDIEDNILSVIPNFKTSVSYRIVQIYDTESVTGNQNLSVIECVFKRTFGKLLNDGDQFLSGDKYDKAVYWKYFELQAMEIKEATTYQLKFNQEIKRLVKEEDVGKKRKMSFFPSAFFKLPYLNTMYGRKRTQ